MSDDDDYSDLTDVGDEEYGPSSSRKKSSKSNSSASTAGGFRVKNALKVPRPTTYTVQALYGPYPSRFFLFDSLITIQIDQIHGSDINLEPDYQRGGSRRTLYSTRPDPLHPRRRLARSKTNRNNRLSLSQFLHPARHFRYVPPLPPLHIHSCYAY